MKAMLYRNFLLSKSILYMAPLSLVATLLLTQIPLAVCAGTLNMVHYVIMLFAMVWVFNKALPIKNSIIVAAYYVCLLLFLLYGVAIQGIGSALCHAVDLGFFFLILSISLSIAMIVSAIEVPLIIHFGEKNMRYVLILIFFVIFLLVGSISDIKVSMVLPSYLFVVILSIAIFILLISYAISTHLYHKKEAHRHRDYPAVRLGKQRFISIQILGFLFC